VFTYVQDGGFVVRESKNGGATNPYALSIYYKQAVYHLLIRQKPNGKFSLGAEKLDEMVRNVTFCNKSELHATNAAEMLKLGCAIVYVCRR
jgi:hypothetical protein